jgi:hypothetical protein
MSLITEIEDLIHRLDKEGAAELQHVLSQARDAEARVLPVLEKLKAQALTAVAGAAEQAAPGLRAALEAAVEAAEQELSSILKI